MGFNSGFKGLIIDVYNSTVIVVIISIIIIIIILILEKWAPVASAWSVLR